MVNTQPQNNAAMLLHGSPQPQDNATVGGFQPQHPVVMGTMQPPGQSPFAMGDTQPYNPNAVGGIQPQSPGMMSPVQPQSPAMMGTVQPQAVAPMEIKRHVFGDYGANKRQRGPDGKSDWTFGLYDCFSRCGLCCWATWCPCVVYSKTRQRLRSLQYEGRPLAGGGERYSDHCYLYSITLFIGHPWIMQVQPRVEMRERYGIRGHVAKDFLTAFCCNACALTQERREVELEEASFQAVQQDVQVDEK